MSTQVRTLVASELRCATHRAYRYVCAGSAGGACCAADDLADLCDDCRAAVGAGSVPPLAPRPAPPPAPPVSTAALAVPPPPNLAERIRAAERKTAGILGRRETPQRIQEYEPKPQEAPPPIDMAARVREYEQKRAAAPNEVAREILLRKVQERAVQIK